MKERTQETLLAAGISLLAEGVAMALFLVMLFVWLAIYATRGMV